MTDSIESAAAPAGAAVVQPRRRPIRDSMVGGLSLAVVVTAAAYIAFPGHETLTMSLRPSSSALFDSSDLVVASVSDSSAVTARSPHEEIYGAITSRGGIKLSHIVIQFRGATPADSKAFARIALAKAGAYRVITHLPTGDYHVVTSLEANGRRMHTDRLFVDDQSTNAGQTVMLTSGRTYDVSGRVTPSGMFSFLPVSSY